MLKSLKIKLFSENGMKIVNTLFFITVFWGGSVMTILSGLFSQMYRIQGHEGFLSSGGCMCGGGGCVAGRLAVHRGAPWVLKRANRENQLI